MRIRNIITHKIPDPGGKARFSISDVKLSKLIYAFHMLRILVLKKIDKEYIINYYK